MGLAEGLGLGPGLEVALALPQGVRGVEAVILGLWPAEEVKFDKKSGIL